ncbi:hypothetical protein [Desulforamulus aquiferis]|uniref:Uncharacterized protein n=1 Tax=Desulforamulus aquiferis TaxID=1397668 RepID=A0AAW7ZHF7_9FIRM|nr:hypothetical protein [Desulforamulus aquiferis]MDO7789199.1 hypothetical protein [Desulforamulus aquiferis]
MGTGGQFQGHALGMGKSEKAALWEILDRYGTVDGDTIWLPGGIKGRIKYTTLTPKGNMRDYKWQGFVV